MQGNEETEIITFWLHYKEQLVQNPKMVCISTQVGHDKKDEL